MITSLTLTPVSEAHQLSVVGQGGRDRGEGLGGNLDGDHEANIGKLWRNAIRQH
jgi:hypothetical protein